jgi:AmiR/NasT family two-component response regulator
MNSDELHAENEELRTENGQLRTALATRIVIEQAKGVLIERLDLPAEDVFGLMRSAARRARRNIHDIAAEILQTRVTPAYIEREIGPLLRPRS